MNLRLAPVLILVCAQLLRLFRQPEDWSYALEFLFALWLGYSAGANSGQRNGRIEVVREILKRERKGRVVFARKHRVP